MCQPNVRRVVALSKDVSPFVLALVHVQSASVAAAFHIRSPSMRIALLATVVMVLAPHHSQLRLKLKIGEHYRPDRSCDDTGL